MPRMQDEAAEARPKEEVVTQVVTPVSDDAEASLDVDQCKVTEKKSITRDALHAGGWLAVGIVSWIVDESVFWTALTAAMVGSNLQSIYMRFRLLDWMTVVQRQDAVVEYLLSVNEKREAESGGPEGAAEGRN